MKRIRAPLIALIACISAVAGLRLLWRLTLPHAITPTNFGLLALDTKMVGFYIDTWGFYLAPILMAMLIIGRMAPLRLYAGFPFGVVLSICVGLMVLLLTYHWQEARFTYYVFPWFLILLCIVLAPRKRWAVGVMGVVLVVHGALVPQNYWIPQWHTIKLHARQSWIGDFIAAQSVNRGLVDCVGDCPLNNGFITQSEGYTQTMMRIYLKLLEQSGSKRETAD